jgi:thioesterase domain-containing protein
VPARFLVDVHTGGSRTPIFQVFGGGHELSRQIGPEWPVYLLTFEVQQQDGSALWHGSVEALAAAYMQEIRAKDTKGARVIGANCFGAFIAIEIARMLEDAGEAPALLILFGPTPTDWSRWTLFTSLPKILPYSNMLRKARPIRHWIRTHLRPAYRLLVNVRYLAVIALERAAYRWHLRSALKALKERRSLTPKQRKAANKLGMIRLFERYQVRSYQGATLVIDGEGTLYDTESSWRPYLSNDAQFLNVPGDANTMMNRDVFSQYSDKIVEVLKANDL